MHIVIGYDDSECARAALGDLAFAGLPADTEALVLAVVDAFLPPEGERADAVLPRLAEVRVHVRDAMRSHYDAAASAAESLRARFPGWTVHTEACADSPAWAIIKRAEGYDGGVGGERADLVVVGSQGKSAIERLWIGSVSAKVLAHARCSVRIARARAAGAGGAPPRLVVGVDGSPDALAAVESIAARPWPAGTQVLVAAFDHGLDVGMEAMARLEAYPRGSDARPTARAWAEAIAREAADSLARCPHLSVAISVETGEPKQGLVERAGAFGEHGADCIFVGARGMRRIERFLLGSVSTHVATTAPCSVEVVRSWRAEES
jgi:nucleotide-binding universal stress UspA family protein